MASSRSILMATAVFTTAMLSSTCSDPASYKITTPEQADAVLAVALNPAGSIPADGVSQVTITVTLDPSAKSTDRAVTLTTTAGTFVPSSASNAAQATVTTDALGKATAILQAPSVPGVAVIHVSVPDFQRDVTATFRQVTAADVFTVAASSSTVAINSPGITVTVSLKFVGTAAQQTVTFKTSLGSLVAPGATGNSVTMPVDLSGNASVILQSSTAGSAQVQVTVNGFTQDVSLTFTSG
jgi:hypothetical protein